MAVMQRPVAPASVPVRATRLFPLDLARRHLQRIAMAHGQNRHCETIVILCRTEEIQDFRHRFVARNCCTDRGNEQGRDGSLALMHNCLAA